MLLRVAHTMFPEFAEPLSINHAVDGIITKIRVHVVNATVELYRSHGTMGKQIQDRFSEYCIDAPTLYPHPHKLIFGISLQYIRE